MALSISSVCRNITPSATLRLNALAAEKRKQGQDIISLAAGEPDFPTP
ncbi:MAG: aspartate transaminase, partial [Clostridiales bacterium]|nr:aspartate transaminase [Clostridiales bacterium]